MKKILLTGGSGFLGSRIRYYYGLMKKEEFVLDAPTHQEMDLTKKEQVMGYVANLKPDLVIHCGTVADTNFVLTHPEESFQITVIGSCHLAEASKQEGIPLLFMSSDYVYQGKSIWGSSYDMTRDALKEEEAATDNEYGRQKLEAEKRCLKLNPRTIALRLSWMYDLPRVKLKNKQNLLTSLIKAAQENKPIFFAGQEYRGITNVWEVIKNLEMAAGLPPGSYNFGSSNRVSTFETARTAASILGIPQNLIGEDKERFAERPRNLTMDLQKIKEYGIVFPDTISSLQSFLPIL